jgi:hypothetical protein
VSLPAPEKDSVALITGASAGIGAGIARELAGRGHDLVMVARGRERLEALAAKLAETHSVNATPLACDVGDATARAELIDGVNELGLRVEILVNNAGFATGGFFHSSPVDRELEQVRVLVEAVVGLCAAYLPGMVERRRGAILTVASTAGMQPLPFSAGYAAAKAHALAFSEALHEEVRGRGVTVTALCPGPVDTEFWELAGDQPIEKVVPGALWVSAAQAARAGVAGLAAGERVVVPGRPMRAIMLGGRYVPNAVKLPIIGRLMRPRRRG